MLRSLNDLERYKVSATDGEVGSTADFLFDDQQWVIRYLVVETAGLLGGPRVLIPPISFGKSNWLTRRFQVALTSDKIKNGPSIDADKPVSGVGWKGLASEHADDTTADVHLRSAEEVRGYHVQGTDEPIGHVEDYIIDDVTWAVRYLVIDTNNWWFGKRVLVAPQWATRVDWSERNVYVDKTREAIKNSPEWNGTDAINREYEGRLYEHLEQTVYWDDELRSQPATGDTMLLDETKHTRQQNANNDAPQRPSRLARLSDVHAEFTAADGRPDVRGWHVKTSDGHKIGTVEDLLVDVAAQRVLYLEVKVSKGALGTSDDRSHLFPIGMARLNDDSDEVYLSASREDIRAMPVYDHNIVNRTDERLLRNRFSPAGATGTRSATPEANEEYYTGDLFNHEHFYGTRWMGP